MLCCCYDVLRYISQSHTVTTYNIMIQNRFRLLYYTYPHTVIPHRPVNAETCFWVPACEAPLSVLLLWLEVKVPRCQCHYSWSCWFAKIHSDSFRFCKSVPKSAKTAGTETTALGAFTASTAGRFQCFQVITWGEKIFTANHPLTALQNNNGTRVMQICSTDRAFAARLEDGHLAQSVSGSTIEMPLPGLGVGSWIPKIWSFRSCCTERR